MKTHRIVHKQTSKGIQPNQPLDDKPILGIPWAGLTMRHVILTVVTVAISFAPAPGKLGAVELALSITGGPDVDGCTIGVHPHRGRWEVVVTHERKEHYGGTFDDEVEAAKARDRLALELFGKYARLNFPPESEPANGQQQPVASSQ